MRTSPSSCRSTWFPRRSCGWTRSRSPPTASWTAGRSPLPTRTPSPRAPTRRRSARSEEALAAIWAELLGVERVGRGDDFFALGGHSLLAVRVISRVRQALGMEAAIGDLFVRPVLADFARGLQTAARAETTAIAPADRTDAVPLSFAQQRLWFLEQLGGLGAAYHIPMRLRLRGDLDRGALVRRAGPHRRPSRGAAHHLPDGGRRAGPAHRPGRGERVPAGGARPPCLGRTRRTSCAAWCAEEARRALRPGAGAALPRAAGCAWRRTTTCCC